MGKVRAKKKMITLDVDNQLKPEYSIHVDYPDGVIGVADAPGTIKLFAHKEGSWTVPGKLHSKLTNDGNGVNFYFQGGPAFRLDYLKLYQMRILLKLDRERSREVGFKERLVIKRKCGK